MRRSQRLRSCTIHLKRISPVPSVPKAEKSIGEVDSISLEDVTTWQLEIYDHLKKSNHLDILKDCDRIFIITNVHFPFNLTCPASSFVTTLVLIGASGVLAPPTVFFPNKELAPQSIFDPDASISSELARDTTLNDNLLSYIQHIFHPWLTAKGNKFPIIIFIDIDPVHVSWSVLSFCTKNHIILLSTTPALSFHPIKSFVLPYLKNTWNIELHKRDQHIAIESVPSMLRKVFEQTITVDLLRSAFRKSGMFPFDPISVLKESLESESSASSLQTFNAIAEPDHTIQSTSELVIAEASQPTTEINPSTVQRALQKDAFPNSKSLQKANRSVRSVMSQPSISSSTQTTQPRAQFHILLGPLVYEFINSGNVWQGAIEITSLFDVWLSLVTSHQHSIHPIASKTTPSAVGEINQQFRIEFEALIGPLLYEFKRSGNVWTGAPENTALFGVWKRILRTLETDDSMEMS